MNHNQPYVVLLTGGYQPGDEDNPPDPGEVDMALARDRAAARIAAVVDAEVIGEDGQPEQYPAPDEDEFVAREAFRIGFHQAAQLGRVVAVWVVADPDTAARFARFITSEVDPASFVQATDPPAPLAPFVRRAGDPLAEALVAYEGSTGRVIR
jgi:hypothetical protein